MCLPDSRLAALDLVRHGGILPLRHRLALQVQPLHVLGSRRRLLVAEHPHDPCFAIVPKRLEVLVEPTAHQAAPAVSTGRVTYPT